MFMIINKNINISRQHAKNWLNIYFNKLGTETILTDFTGCFRESGFLRRFKGFESLKQLIADEIVIIGKKKM